MVKSIVQSVKNWVYHLIAKIENLSLMPSPSTLLTVSLFTLISISLLMIASASIPFATTHGLDPLYFFKNQALYVAIGLVAAWVVYKVPLQLYCSFGFVVASFVVTILLLIATVLFGSEINGSQRWINLGLFNFQAAELCKAVAVLLTSEYVVRRSADVRDSVWHSWRLLIWYVPMSSLLLIQPDYGSFVMIAMTSLVLLFVSGVPLRTYLTVAALAGALLGAFAFSSEYRRERLFGFTDPFSDMQDSGYQLANSLIAFGRGQFFGVGYGDSVQKLSHLPEAHTDFLLAITGEELGMFGVMLVLALEFLIVASIMAISYMTLKRRQLRLSYTTFGFAILIFGQIVINAGMNMGMLPTKGLTLPFFSYGGSSMLIMMMMIGYVLQVAKRSDEIMLQRDSSKY